MKSSLEVQAEVARDPLRRAPDAAAGSPAQQERHRDVPDLKDILGKLGNVGAQTALGRWWYSLPVRLQLMISISIISIGAVLLSIVLAVVDARSRVEVEVSASMELAQQLVTDMVKRLASDGQIGELLDVMPEQLKYVRHARILVSDGHGELVQITPDAKAGSRYLLHPERAPSGLQTSSVRPSARAKCVWCCAKTRWAPLSSSASPAMSSARFGKRSRGAR